MKEISILAITKNGLKIATKLNKNFPEWKIFAPKKFQLAKMNVNWFSESTSSKIGNLFKTNDAIICIFSLGAVIRLISPYIKNKKNDPAVIVIDDKAKFVISALSGHLGGANELSLKIATKIGAIPVITTAADVNKTIPVDLVGKQFGWVIEDDSTVTKVSAMMVNEEKIGVLQEVGETNWWNDKLPRNVKIYSNLKQLEKSKSKGYLIITDRLINSKILASSVVYRPKSLVVGIGLHWDTSKTKIKKSLESTLKKFHLSEKSIAKIVSIKKPKDVKGLTEFAKEKNIPVEFIDKNKLETISTPNPSKVVAKFEGTPSVSEASAIFASKGKLIVEKQKFPPDLTIAIARIEK